MSERLIAAQNPELSADIKPPLVLPHGTNVNLIVPDAHLFQYAFWQFRLLFCTLTPRGVRVAAKSAVMGRLLPYCQHMTAAYKLKCVARGQWSRAFLLVVIHWVWWLTAYNIWLDSNTYLPRFKPLLSKARFWKHSTGYWMSESGLRINGVSRRGRMVYPN